MTAFTRLRALLLPCLLLLAGIAVPARSLAQPGQLLGYEPIGTWGPERLQAIVDRGLDLFLTGGTMSAGDFRAGFARARLGVKLFKVKYASIIPELQDRPVVAYGLVAIPEQAPAGTPIVSYQHGTIFDRSWTPSNPEGSFETQLMLAQFASQGYVVVAADYFGTTQSSDVPNSYLLAQSTAQACLDLYRAARTVLEREGVQPGKLFVNGWSQGGYSTLAFLRYLELAGIPVTAAGVAAGPADLLLFAAENLYNPKPFQASFAAAGLSNLMQAVGHYHGQQEYFARSIQPQYLQAARDLFAFKIGYEEFVRAAPGGIRELFRPEFFADGKAALKPFWRILDQSSAYRWRMRTPLRTFHSERDEAIPIAAARVAVIYQNMIGNEEAQAFDAGPNADHRAVYLYSLVNLKPWFDGLR
ncbi:MAG: hypothetical protein B9S27_03275 [Opitutia bacterium Tous-C8FEB]|nr:MAG: hypothetical protein B9S27_03275 [Opitutae bacterium Tous-C8FEB]